jgi:hypothetical protein
MVDSLWILHPAAMGAVLISFVCAAMARDLLYSVICLATGSVLLFR